MNKHVPQKQYVLGVGIDDVNLNQALDLVEKWLKGKSNKKYYIVTPNPEFLMAALDNLEFRKILNHADLAIPDGAGLKLSGKIQNTTAGVDLMEKLCQLSAKEGSTVGFLGGRDGVAEKASEHLQKKYPGLKVAFAESGPEVDQNGQSLGVLSPSVSQVCPRPPVGGLAVDARDLSFGATPRDFPPVDLLFVGFGQVKQEKWIAKNLDKLPVKVAMGVGGAFDYLSGNIKRAPVWMRNLGLEWLFRLIMQPSRIKRQFQLLRFAMLIKQ